MKNIGIVWFRNDLRLLDNEALTNAINSCDEVMPIYIFDERIFLGKTKFGFRKTGCKRAKFILESVIDLKKNLQEIGSDLYIRIGKPEEIITQIANECKASWVFCNREMTSEEIEVQDALEKNLWATGREVFYSRGKMLYYTADLPFPVLHTPDIFTNFRKEVERFVAVRLPLEKPTQLKPFAQKNIELGDMPCLSDFEFKDQQVDGLEQHFVGGETTALNQLNYYIWETGLIAKYKESRNGLLGWDYSSKFSAWLSVGALSPKTIYHEIKKFESQKAANESTYWLIFELLWRDFFRLMGKKYINNIFKKGGLIGKDPGGHIDWALFDAWANGKTGVPFIDANMRELKATGFMSNRGRQNVASFLVKDLGLNWLMGAEYFESQLIDYDPCSNYGNWNYIAGIGNDPREDRYFNILSQAKKYDGDGEFVRYWIPELSKLPANLIHQPNLLTIDQLQELEIEDLNYPQPIIDVSKWN